jgi:hypothetical protein
VEVVSSSELPPSPDRGAAVLLGGHSAVDIHIEYADGFVAKKY